MDEIIIMSIISLSILLFISKLFEDFSRKMRLPSFLGSIISGIILGPAIFNVVKVEYFLYLKIFFILGINFLLFLAGAEEISEILTSKLEKSTIILSLMMFILPMAFFGIFAYKTGIIGLKYVIVLSIIIGIIDMGPVVKGLIESGHIGTKEGMNVVKISLITEILGIIIFDIFLTEYLSVYALLLSLIKVILMFIVVILLGHYVIVPFIRYIDNNFRAYEATFATLVSIILLLSYIGEFIGVPSPVISLMLGGYLSGCLRQRPDQLEKIKAFSMGFFEPLFFAGIGVFVTVLNFGILYDALLFVVVFSIPKLIVGLFVTRKRIVLSFLSKGGISAALLLILLTDYALISETTYSIFIISMLIMTIIASFAFIGGISVEMREIEKVTLKDIMEEPVFVYDYQRISEFIDRLLKEVSIIVVNRHKKPIGVINSVDLVYVNPRYFDMIKVSDIMRTQPMILSENLHLNELISIIYDTTVEVIAVVNNDDVLVGIIRTKNLIKIFLEKKELFAKTSH